MTAARDACACAQCSSSSAWDDESSAEDAGCSCAANDAGHEDSDEGEALDDDDELEDEAWEADGEAWEAEDDDEAFDDDDEAFDDDDEAFDDDDEAFDDDDEALDDDDEAFDDDGNDAHDFLQPRFRLLSKFSDSEKQTIIAAIKLAEQMAAVGLGKLDDVYAAGEGTVRVKKRRNRWRNAWNSRGDGKIAWKESPLHEWFGKWGRLRMHKAHKSLRRIDKYLSRKTLIIGHAKTAIAWGLWHIPRRLWIGPKFFNVSPDCRALSLIHELAHASGVARDKYRREALKLKPKWKVRNADNYGYYCLSQYYFSLNRTRKDVDAILDEPC